MSERREMEREGETTQDTSASVCGLLEVPLPLGRGLPDKTERREIKGSLRGDSKLSGQPAQRRQGFLEREPGSGSLFLN